MRLVSLDVSGCDSRALSCDIGTEVTLESSSGIGSICLGFGWFEVFRRFSFSISWDDKSRWASKACVPGTTCLRDDLVAVTF